MSRKNVKMYVYDNDLAIGFAELRFELVEEEGKAEGETKRNRLSLPEIGNRQR
jgi:hypothetical protein